jgi:dipeptidyl aminopeptidase/acylaminoacyl peptidase
MIAKSEGRKLAALLVTTLALILMAGVGPVSALAAEDSPEFTLARFLEVPTLYSVKVSPDGSRVVWLESRRDLEDDKRITRLWLADLKDGKPRQMTFVDSGVGGIAWRPDGSLSFIRKHDDASQVWINSLDGSEPRPVTDLEGGVGAYWWSPDGKYLAVLADPAEPETEEAGETGEDVDPMAAPIFEVEEDRQDWTVWDRIEHPEEYQQLWIIAATDGDPDFEPQQLTEAPLHPYHAAWSPDGRTLALTFNARFSSLVDEEQKIGLVDVDSGEMEIITPATHHSSLAAFSPDGSKLAYYTDREAELRAYLNLKDVVVRDLKTGDTRVLTGESELTLGGSGSTPAVAPIWDAKGKSMYLPVAEGTTRDLYRLDAGSGKLENITKLAGSLDSMNMAGGKLAYVESALDKPGTLYAGKPGSVKAIRSVNDAVAAYNLPEAKKLRLPGHEGGFVEGFLFLPPGATENDKLPAIIEMHGGPYSRYGNAWTSRYPWQVLAKNGFAVFIVNPRGGTGYGAEFLQGVYRNFGTDDFQDIMAAVDALAERGTIDPDRLGFTGYSYGGLMTNVVVSRTDRFKAAVSIAGIWNYTSAMGQNNPQLFIDSYNQPWDGDLALMWEHSPASRANKITTPTLIMHGKDDEPVDPRQSIEMFSYLQLNGVPSRLVLYPGEGHGINQPAHMIDYQTRELQWFLHYVMGQEDAVGAEEPVPVEE